ncbi:hypothetical protein FSW04_15185 [Baekduia soli]|uniref:Uncharacterized protein n=1 Tax=Baekduia soli TaxID=496014 RepID=A0A5B8U6S2_9ACTN|nr:hypothetical protein [Baekduia soli]QEC48784.1 hypothetical protein FSW04_15185 [Baekduia soli]
MARRIYAQAAHGRNVASVTRRLDSSSALANAVARGDAAAARAALLPLMKNQVRQIVISRGGRTLVRIGTTPSLAPVTRTIRSASGASVGTYRLSVASDVSIAGTMAAVTGDGVSVQQSGRAVVADAASGRPTASVDFAATAFSGAPLTFRLAMPAAPPSQCGASDAQTRALTIGAIGRRLFAAEQSGGATARVLRHVTSDPRVVQAVAHDDPGALRAEIVHLFGDRTLHVVRIRATTASGALVNDVGGPYVLAPASAPVKLGARVIGRVTLSIQDDTGYIKLMHRFTGAVVQLSTPAGPVPGSNVPVPGVTYRRVTFTVQAFPSGPLQVSLLS